MRILHVNKFLYRRGGAEAYMEDLAALQTARGHEVAFYGMDHPRNPLERRGEEQPGYIEFEPLPPTLPAKLKALGRMLHSPSSAAGLAKVLRRFRPDVVHLHNIYHHLSPSVLRPASDAGVPMVMTLHDYKLMCPTYRFLDHGAPCEACVAGGFRQAVVRRCKDGSLAHSAALAAESFFQRTFNRYDKIHLFICPSRFIAGKMVEAGLFRERLRIVNHFVDVAAIAPAQGAGEGVLFAGRLSPEKGADTLISAMAELPVGVRLDIVGEGPQEPELREAARALEQGRVRFRGHLPRDGVLDAMRASAAVVVPSRWYENQPITILEALACGVPVIGTDLGGTSELITHGVEGRLVPPNDTAALADALGAVVADPAAAAEMGRRARERAERDFAPDAHLDRILALYEEASRRAA